MKTSICLAVYHRASLLELVLASIRRQSVPFPYEIVVADDGSPTDDEKKVCRKYDVEQYIRLDDRPYFSSSVWARNAAYRAARGEVLILQSSDVLHHCPKTIQYLTETLQPNTCVFGRTFNVYPDHKGEKSPVGSESPILTATRGQEYVGPVGAACRRPLFFLGAAWRRDVYAIGGNDEDFVYPGYEDTWFGDCLLNGLNLSPLWPDRVVGFHHDHDRVPWLSPVMDEMGHLYRYKRNRAASGVTPWCAASGPWPLE
jgi:glycosyltransferase involved in cell wall biosynthesis